MKPANVNSVKGVFKHLIFSPKGEIEGVLLDCDGSAAQLVFDRKSVEGDAFLPLHAGQVVTVEALLQGASPKGRGNHPTHAFVKLVSVDGKKPARPKAARSAAFQGTVVRLNYARHGAPNGVVLDSGDFIHTKPEGMAKLGLKVGDTVAADGASRRLADNRGSVVEAERVNGKRLGPR